MRTTVDIPNDLMHQVLAFSAAKTKREAILLSLRDFIKRKRLEKLAQAKGTLALKEDWQEFRHRR